MSTSSNRLPRELEDLAAMVPELRADHSIGDAEALEQRFKRLVAAALAAPADGATARHIAAIQNEIGFIPKFKSYSIKASLPLGYSVFLHNEREGFSFQQHTSHKVEVFHILDVMPGGYVFVCPFAEWEKAYEPERFAAWMNGNPDRAFDCHRFEPQPGDVFRIDQLGVVHTVIGCTLEEFANTSVDMVDRLHDQNAGRPIPAKFSRAYMEAAIASLSLPSSSAIVHADGTRTAALVEPFDGGTLTVLSPKPLYAHRGALDGGRESPWWRHDEASAIHVWQGDGELLLADDSELRGPQEPLAATRGSVFLVPPGIHYRYVNRGKTALLWSEQRLPLDQAFVEAIESSPS